MIMMFKKNTIQRKVFRQSQVNEYYNSVGAVFTCRNSYKYQEIEMISSFHENNCATQKTMNEIMYTYM